MPVHVSTINIGMVFSVDDERKKQGKIAIASPHHTIIGDRNLISIIVHICKVSQNCYQSPSLFQLDLDCITAIAFLRSYHFVRISGGWCVHLWVSALSLENCGHMNVMIRSSRNSWNHCCEFDGPTEKCICFVKIFSAFNTLRAVLPRAFTYIHNSASNLRPNRLRRRVNNGNLPYFDCDRDDACARSTILAKATELRLRLSIVRYQSAVDARNQWRITLMAEHFHKRKEEFIHINATEKCMNKKQE